MPSTRPDQTRPPEAKGAGSMIRALRAARIGGEIGGGGGKGKMEEEDACRGNQNHLIFAAPARDGARHLLERG